MALPYWQGRFFRHSFLKSDAMLTYFFRILIPSDVTSCKRNATGGV